MGTFLQCDLATSRLEMSKSSKSLLKHCFFKKRINFELIRNITHQMKSLRAFYTSIESDWGHLLSRICHKNTKRTTNTGKKRKICTKNYERKRCPPNQLNIKLITKNNKNLFFAFFADDAICKSNDAHYCNTVKRKQKPTKKEQICKNREN